MEYNLSRDQVWQTKGIRMTDGLLAQKPVFVSYSSDDRAFVERLTADLRNRGVNIWIDQTGLRAGTPDWEQALRDAIRQSHAVLLVASRSARLSRYVKDEIRIAQMYGRPLYPVWAVGEEWIDCIPMGLGGTQFVDARASTYTAALDEIISALSDEPLTASPAEDEIAPADNFVPRNPYKGLRAFRRDDAGDFFGREALVAELVDIIRAMTTRSDNVRMLILLGPSGSGKSSVIMAGLLPRLGGNAVEGSQGWVYLDPLVPGDHPLERLTLALAGTLPERSLASIREDLEDDSARGLHLLAGRIAGAGERQVVLIVDQFEELFTLTRDEDERRWFIDLLVNAATEPRGQLIVLITLRADFYDRPLKYPALGKLLEGCSRALLPMDVTDLRSAIEKPAALPDVRLILDDGLAGDLLFEVRGEPTPLPLLQFALDQLFQRREGRHLTRAAYKQIGGVRGALARHAEQTYLDLPSDAHRHMARALFLRLIEPGTTEQDTTRRRAARSELELADAEGTQRLRESADQFINARLLVASRSGAVDTLEVGHEALIALWDRLAAWLKDARDDIRRQQQIGADSAEWVRRGRQPNDDGLYRGELLIDAEAWAARNLPSADEQTFIQTSAARQAQLVAAEEARIAELNRATTGAQRARRLLTFVGAAAAVLIVGSLVAVGRAQQQVSEAEQTLTPVPLTIDAANALVGTAQYEAELARADVSDAQDLLSNTELELELAWQRQRLAATQAAAAATDLRIAGSTLTPIPPTLTALAQRVQQQSDFTYSLRLSSLARDLAESNGAQLARLSLSVALAANEVESPPIEARRTLAELAYAPGVTRVLQRGRSILSPDGRLAVAQSGVIWDIETGRDILTLEGEQLALVALAFSPDMHYVAAATNFSPDPAVIFIWDLETGALVHTINQGLDEVGVLAFSPDSQMLASGGGLKYSETPTGELFIWDVASGRKVRGFEGHTRAVTDLDFTPDGRYLLAGGGDAAQLEIFLWDITTGDQVRAYLGHVGTGLLGQAIDLSIRPDGSTFISASSDKVIWWDLTTGEQLRTYPEEGYSITISPDGMSFVYTRAGRLYMRNVDSGELQYESPRYAEYFSSLSFLPDGEHLYTDSDLGALLWDLTNGALEQRYGGAIFGLQEVAFSPDGTRILSAAQEGHIRVWDALSGELELNFDHTQGMPSAVAASPDGLLAASADWGSNIYIWELESGKLIHSMLSPNPENASFNEVNSVAFSPDGRTLASVGRNNAVALWDVETGALTTVLYGHLSSVFGTTSVAFSPDGRYFASGAGDMQVILWDVQTGLMIRVLGSHNSGCINPSISALAFSPDSRNLLSGGCDRNIIEWDVETGERLRTLIGHTTEDLRSVGYSPDARYALSSDGWGSGRTVYWDLEGGLPLYVFDGIMNAISPNGGFAAVGLAAERGYEVQLIRLDTEERLIEWVRNNRALWPFSCDDRLALEIQPVCAGS
jgi:WD40 repeat protein